MFNCSLQTLLFTLSYPDLTIVWVRTRNKEKENKDKMKQIKQGENKRKAEK
jgi:hypothetical protein